MIPVPRQCPTNTWDCGVFVCKFADVLYQQHQKIIKVKDLNTSIPLTYVISNSSYMLFDRKDIEEMRIEMVQLVDILSNIYLRFDGCTSEEKKDNHLFSDQHEAANDRNSMPFS